MKLQKDPFFRVVAGLFAVPAAALAIIGLSKLKERADERRVADFVRHVQPQLAADQRFKYVKLKGDYASGCVSNTEALASLKRFLQASKPPIPLSLSLVRANTNDWAEQEHHERLMELDRQGRALVATADALLEPFVDGVSFLAPANTNLVKTVPE